MASEKRDGLEADAPAISHGHEDITDLAMQVERDMTLKNSLRLWPKAILFSLVISLAIIMEVRLFTGLQLTTFMNPSTNALPNRATT